MDLNNIAVFVKVAQLGSFTRAATALGMPVSTVSRKISELEQGLHTTLLQRTTRKLSLTTQGRAYFERCAQPLGLLQEAENEVIQKEKEPEGFLRISVPVILGEEVFLTFISDFISTYPLVKIDLNISNRFSDLISENIDLAVRFGPLRDPSLSAQKLGTSFRYVVASKKYLKGKTLPVVPDDLTAHDCILLNGKHNRTGWELQNRQKHKSVSVSGPLSSSDFQTVSSFVYRGHGIGFLPSAYCDEQIKSGQLIRLLPDWSSVPFDVHAVYPKQNFIPARLKVLLSALRAWKSTLWI